MFFNIGAGEMMLIAIVLLIAVGPEQLPGVIRKVGRTMGQLKSMSDRLRDDFMTGMNQIEDATDVKSWADKLDTPWAGPIDNSTWAKNIDPPFTAKRADPEGSSGSDESSGSHESGDAAESGEPRDVAADSVELDDAETADAGPEGGAQPPPDDEHEKTTGKSDPVRPETLASLGDEPAASTNGHSDTNGSGNGTDEAPDPMAEDRE